MADKFNNMKTFELTVNALLVNWPALKISKEHGFGGSNSQAKEKWLCESVVQIFQDNDHVYPEELEDFISEAMFNEFDTVVEDGSLALLCKQLCHFCEMCSNGKQVLVEEEVNKIVSIAKTAPKAVVQNTEEEVNEQPTNQQTRSLAEVKTSHAEEQEVAMETEDDGWEVVKPKKR